MAILDVVIRKRHMEELYGFCSQFSEGRFVPVGDICKCAMVNIYEPLNPAEELITISKHTDIAFNSCSIGPERSIFRNNWLLLEVGKPQLLRNNKALLSCVRFAVSSGMGLSGGPAPCTGAMMGSLGHPMCLIKKGLHLDL